MAVQLKTFRFYKDGFCRFKYDAKSIGPAWVALWDKLGTGYVYDYFTMELLGEEQERTK